MEEEEGGIVERIESGIDSVLGQNEEILDKLDEVLARLAEADEEEGPPADGGDDPDDPVGDGDSSDDVSGIEVVTELSICQGNATVMFAGPTRVARFGTQGYAVEPGARIIGQTPITGGGRNGGIVNPEISSALHFDDRASAGWAYANNPYPVTFEEGDSLVATVSRPHDSSIWDAADHPTSIAHGPTMYAEVITCVPLEQLSQVGQCFRLPYVTGSDKTLRRIDDIDYSKLLGLGWLGGSDVIFGIPSGYNLASRFAWSFTYPWILHVSNWVGRQAHPTQNMPNYHREIFRLISDAAWIVNSALPGVRDLALHMVQCGLDHWHTARLVPFGTPDGEAADSAISRFLVLFAGHLLGDDEMLAFSYMDRTRRQAYLMSEHVGSHLSTHIPFGETWTGASYGWRKDPMREHELLHPLLEFLVTFTDGTRAINFYDQQEYMGINVHTWPSQAAVAELMGLREYWAHHAFFVVAKRWMEENPLEILDGFTYVPHNPYQHTQSHASDLMYAAYAPV